MSGLLGVLVLLGLVGANAFFVIGEYAVVTARRSRIAPLAATSARARAALRLMDDPVRVISTVQVGITALGILTGALGEPIVRDALAGRLPDWTSFVLAFAIVTYLSVVLGELAPKALTLDRAERLAMLVARPITLISVALRPVVWVLERSAAVLLRPFGVGEVIAGAGIRSAEELRALVDEAEETGVIPRAQEELLSNVFDFAGLQARDVMVPAPDVVWLDAALSPADALDALLASGHAMAPVARGTLDRVVGGVHVRDLASASRSGAGGALAALARPVAVVPETKALPTLLRELRARRESLAVVGDDYGTAGIVTLGDVLEALVGTVEDAFDVPGARMQRIDARTVRLAGSVTVAAANDALGTRLPRRGAHTVAGLVFDALGRRPVVGDRVELDGVALAVEELDGVRITRLTLTLPETLPG